MTAVFPKLVGASFTALLIANVSYVQFAEAPSCDSGSGELGGQPRDLFDLVPTYSDVVRVVTLALATFGVCVTALDALYPRKLRRTMRPAGNLVATTTSAI